MIAKKEDHRLQVGVLGCGAIAQAAHFEACTKARNADLYAVCDVAADLRERMSAMHGAAVAYARFEEMLADPRVDAVIIATADIFHVPAAKAALAAGKHVLCEKPIGVSVADVEDLKQAVARSGRHLQIGHMKRFDAGLQAARTFVNGDMGEMLALKAWYCDSTHRYEMTDAVQPLIVTSAHARKPSDDPKQDLRRYFLLAHGSHLVDTARFLAGRIDAVEARLNRRYGAYCWFVHVAFANGAIGHLDLTVAVRMDWHEGFTIHGENGSIVGRTFNPWYFRSSEVEIFHERDATVRRPLGADGHFYRRQLEGFADVILYGAPATGADIDDGIASMRALAAIAESVQRGGRVRLADAAGPI